MTGAMPGSGRGARCFEDLWIWQSARELVGHVYRDFGEGTPAARDFGYRKQINDAAVSVMNNIAEGFERRTRKEFARFLDIAKGSCGEVRSMYYVAEDLKYLTAQAALERRQHASRLSAGIATFRARLEGD
jgi:four helix bundle protein